MTWTTFVEGHPGIISTNLYWNLDKPLQKRRFLKFGHFAPFLMHAQQPKFSMEIKSLNNYERQPPKDLPCFSTNWYSLNNFCRGSPKEHFYQIIMKSYKQIQIRRFLKPPFWCCSNQSSHRNLNLWTFWKRTTKETFLWRLVENSPVEWKELSFVAKLLWWRGYDCVTNHYSLNKLSRGSLK